MVGARGAIAVGRGREDLDRARLGVGALGLADHGAHAVAGQRAGDEDDVAVAGARRRCRRGRGVSTVSSSSAPRAGRLAEVGGVVTRRG